MIKIIAIVLQVVGVAGGVFIGLQLKSGGGDGAGAHAMTDGEPHSANADGEKSGADKKTAAKTEKKSDKKKKSGHGKEDGHSDGPESGHGFLKFSRQFIVPVIKEDGVNSLVVLDINLEVPSSVAETAYTQEPKLRDALLRALLALSNEGVFSNQLLEAENMDFIRTRLLEAARAILGDDVNEVLILSIARQDL